MLEHYEDKCPDRKYEITEEEDKIITDENIFFEDILDNIV